jgi:hypothetical protein
MYPRTLILTLGLLLAALPFGAAAEDDLIASVTLDVVIEGYDGTFCWFHPRAGSVPGAGKDGGPAVIVTMQKWFTSASDYFSGLSVMRTDDLGKTWTPPDARQELAWREEAEGVTAGVCDFTPGWHAPTGKLLGIGHTVRYQDAKLLPEPRPRETGYAVCDPKTMTWTTWRVLEMPDNEEFFSAGNGCGQWLVEADGTVLVPAYFKGKSESKMEIYGSTVLRCKFDGESLTYLEHGEPLRHDVPRGVYEPSITRFGGRYYITLRNDERGYVSVSDDGLNYAPKKPWTFDDGEELGSYNTQQHWVTHSDGLYLSYTRKGANNDHIMRHRAPLFLAKVDPERLVVLRDTERIIIPERGATLGNFGVVTVNADETWVTVGEGMFAKDAMERGANGRVYAARIRWSKPNALAD